ncbi:MAG TPA: hypothetical protein VH247_06375 [Thermoleophilaceae bacterium]|jgi:hypothetical protein|nr:hypothetical protein [Thermoleophilaceae bacterium]
MRDGHMHQTTLRFGPDLWEALEQECALLGVSVAQFVRESALARLAYTAGRRRDVDYAETFAGAGAGVVARAGAAVVDRADAAGSEQKLSTARTYPDATQAQLEASEQFEAAAAVAAQSRLVWRRSRDLREQAAALRRQRRARLE